MTSLIVAGMLVCSAANADQVSNSEETRQLAQTIIAGFIDGREKLQSGTFTVVGDMNLTQREKYPVEGEIRIFSAFDFPKERLRFDQTQPDERHPKGSEGRRRGGRFVRTEDVRIQWLLGQETAEISWSKTLGGKQKGSALPLFDARLVGIANWGSLDHDVQWKDMTKYLSAPVKSVTEDEAGIYKVVWEPISPGVKFIVWFDKNKDFVPVAYEEYWGSPTKKVENWGKPRSTGRTEWTRIHEVWVPLVCEQTRRASVEEFRTLRFKWTSVNESPDEALFTAEGMELPDTVRVQDARRSSPPRIPSRELLKKRRPQTVPPEK